MKNIKYTLLTLLIPFIGLNQVDRSIIPTAGEAKEIKLKDSEVFTTSNGITVILSENHKIPRVAINYISGADEKLEGDKAGLSSMAGELIMSGTSNLTKDQLDNKIDFIGANLSASQNSIRLSCLTKHFLTGLSLMEDIAKNASFPQDEVDRIKKQAESNLSATKSSADEMANNAVVKVNFSGHPYSNVMTESTLENISREDLVSYYESTFTPRESYIVIVGDINREDAERLVNKHFGSWEGESPYKKKYQSTSRNSGGNRVFFVDKPGAVQSVIYITFPVDMDISSPDQIEAKLLFNILGGGGFGNRLMQNLREDKAYTYGCYSRLSLTDNGSWISAGGNFRNEVTDSAIVEIMYELKNIATHLVSDKELSMTKASSSGRFARSLEQPSTVARFALNSIKYNLDKDYYQKYLQNLNNVSKEMVLGVAEKYIPFENCNIVVVGNSEIIDKLLPFDSDNNIEMLDPFGNPKERMRPSDLTGNEIINNYLMKVTGSKNMTEVIKKNKSIKTYKEVTELSMAQMPGALTLTKMFKSPKTSSMKMEMNGMVLQSGYFTGKKGFNQNMQTGKKDLTKEEVEEKKKSFGLFPQLNYAKNKITVEAIGIEPKGSEEYYVIKIIDGKNEEFQYFNKNDFLLTNTLSIVTAPEGGEPTENSVEYSDYKEVDGILFPQTQIMSFGNVTFSGAVKSNQMNSDIDFSEFKEK
ncbi:insulinase family protein [bacterium]|nr:insulinase family protein [bacterium]